MRALDEARAGLRGLEQQVTAAATARDALVDRRFELLSCALCTINAELSKVRGLGWGTWQGLSKV